MRRAKELNPDNPDVYHFYGHYLELAGRFDEAISETKRGLDFNPTSPVINAELGWAYYVARRYDPTIAQGRKTLELDATFVYASWIGSIDNAKRLTANNPSLSYKPGL